MFAHLHAVWKFRYFWLSLVKMDLRSRYRRSILGIGWSVLHPVVMSAVFCLVFSKIMNIQEARWQELGYPEPWRGYAAFLVAGMVTWIFMQTSAIIGCNALIHNESYIRQCPLPYSIYPLRTVMGTGIHFLISIAVVFVLVALLKGSFEPFRMIWAVLPAIVLLFCFCWAIATLAAFATVYFHDTSHLIEVGSQLFFFLTPIMYDRSLFVQNGMEILADLNPAVTYLDLIRTPIVTGIAPEPQLYLQAVALTAVFVGLAAGTIGWLQKKVIFQL